MSNLMRRGGLPVVLEERHPSETRIILLSCQSHSNTPTDTFESRRNLRFPENHSLTENIRPKTYQTAADPKSV